MTKSLLYRFFSVLLGTAALTLATMSTTARAEDALKMGITPREAPRVMFQKFTPLAQYLSKELGVKVELVVGKDFQATIDGLGSNQFQIALLTPSAYPKCEKQYPDAGVQPLVRFQTGGSGTYKACVFVPADSAIASLGELKGKKVAFGDATSTASHLMPKAMLLEAGIVPDKDLVETQFLGSHTNVATAVAVKTFDAGACMDSVAERFAKEGKLKIIAQSRQMPDAPICVNKNIKPELTERIAAALLKLKAGDADATAILTAINDKYTGCEPATAKDYDSIREMAQKLDGDDWYKKK